MEWIYGARSSTMDTNGCHDVPSSHELLAGTAVDVDATAARKLKAKSSLAASHHGCRMQDNMN